MKHLITMTSITYAVKAQNLLLSKGYKCSIVSTPKNLGSGCGYSISVYDNPETIATILRKNGIKYKEVF
jgi:hypothetical protein